MRLLVATDGSAHAERAVAFAARLVGASREADVVVLYVVHVPPIAYEASAEVGAYEEALEKAGADILACAAGQFPGDRVTVVTRLRRGEPGAEIIAAAGEAPVDLIVLGCRGHGQLHQLLLGSVSERVVRSAAVPVLIVR